MSPYIQAVMTVAFAYSTVTVGLWFTLTSGQFSVAHAAMFGIGGYASGLASVKWQTPFVLSLVIGSVAAGIAGLIIGFVLQRTSGMLLGTVTIAIGQALSLIVTNVESLGRSQGYSGIPLRTNLVWAAAVAAFALAVVLLLRRSRVGMAMLAMGKDETVSQSLGVSLLRMRMLGFGVGAALAGLGGGLIAHYNGIIEPANMSYAAEPLFFIFLLVGGITTPWGAFFGTIGVWWFQELLRFGDSGKFLFLDLRDRYWILGAVLVLMVILRPSGILRRRALRAPAAMGQTSTPAVAADAAG